MEKGLQFTGEEVVYMYLHFDTYINTISENLEKQLKFSRAQLRMLEDVYGDDDKFDKELHELQSKLLNEEIPALINKRLDYMHKMRDRFKDSYELILDVDPDFVENIKQDLFNEGDTVNDLLEQIKNKKNNEYED